MTMKNTGQDDQTKDYGFDYTGAEPPTSHRWPVWLEVLTAPLFIMMALGSYYLAKCTGAFEDNS